MKKLTEEEINKKVDEKLDGLIYVLDRHIMDIRDRGSYIFDNPHDLIKESGDILKKEIKKLFVLNFDEEPLIGSRK